MNRPAARPDYLNIDFDERPVTVAWEITRACALACRHCRAEANPQRDPRELTPNEALGVVDQITELGAPILVITGGDPLMRPDVYAIADYASSKGLRVALSPSATALLRQTPQPSADEIKKGLQGNICRCTGYWNIVDAVTAASGQEVPDHEA